MSWWWAVCVDEPCFVVVAMIVGGDLPRGLLLTFDNLIASSVHTLFLVGLMWGREKK